MAAGSQPVPQDQQQQQGGGDPLADFRALAQQVQQLAQKYPEFSESAVPILKAIQAGMVKVSGNSQRTPEKQAPPMS